MRRWLRRLWLRLHGLPDATLTVDGQEVRPKIGNTPVTDWWARVHDPDGNLVYAGPAPVPDDVGVATTEDLAAGRLFRFEMVPVPLEHPRRVRGLARRR